MALSAPRFDGQRRGAVSVEPTCSNLPAVVIGRHQNPWIEANVPYLKDHGIALARRHSGGGTVYHDLANVNFSFLTEHARHCRPRNLQLIAAALNAEFGFRAAPNKRDDMLLQPGDRKVSGTAARIARSRAYHHLTLLVDVDLSTLKASLDASSTSIETNATKSTRASQVGCLRQDRQDIEKCRVVNTVIQAFGQQFDSVETQTVDNVLNEWSFPGVTESFAELRSWEWLFGHTPKFTVRLSSGARIVVEKGVISSVQGTTPPSIPLINQRFDLTMLKL